MSKRAHAPAAARTAQAALEGTIAALEDALLLVLERSDYDRVRAHGFDGQLKAKTDAIARAPILEGCLQVRGARARRRRVGWRCGVCHADAYRAAAVRACAHGCGVLAHAALCLPGALPRGSLCALVHRPLHLRPLAHTDTCLTCCVGPCRSRH